MIKQVWIAECDCCGCTEDARKIRGRYSEVDFLPPKGWGYGNNKNFHLCPKCAEMRERGTSY